MQEFGLIKIFTWKHLTNWRPVFRVFPRAQSALIFVSTLNSFWGDVEGQNLVVAMILTFVEAAAKGQLSVSMTPP